MQYYYLLVRICFVIGSATFRTPLFSHLFSTKSDGTPWYVEAYQC